MTRQRDLGRQADLLLSQGRYALGIQGSTVKAGLQGTGQPAQGAVACTGYLPPEARECLFEQCRDLGAPLTGNHFNIAHVHSQQAKRLNIVFGTQPVSTLPQGSLGQPGKAFDHQLCRGHKVKAPGRINGQLRNAQRHCNLEGRARMNAQTWALLIEHFFKGPRNHCFKGRQSRKLSVLEAAEHIESAEIIRGQSGRIHGADPSSSKEACLKNLCMHKDGI
ncbi:hypothetical protein [Pseudomonas psychrophila]|uniref:hypothetical protein n=1 Tax=Pseudomonas psychrophila TaxID=122355 RepID=UPI0012EBC628|nr:hypothetical protein [Pseudomonas psychrophila]